MVEGSRTVELHYNESSIITNESFGPKRFVIMGFTVLHSFGARRMSEINKRDVTYLLPNISMNFEFIYLLNFISKNDGCRKPISHFENVQFEKYSGICNIMCYNNFELSFIQRLSCSERNFKFIFLLNIKAFLQHLLQMNPRQSHVDVKLTSRFYISFFF